MDNEPDILDESEEPEVLEPLPGPQTHLINAADVFEVFIGGNRGGGKTFAMLLDWLDHQDRYGKKAAGLMVRRTFKELEDVIKEAQKIFPRQGAKWTNSTDIQQAFVFPNGSVLKFRHLDNDSDADFFQGHQYSRLYIEEAGAFLSPEPIFKLMATLRVPGVNCGIRLTANPGGSGVSWLRKRYVDPAPNGYKLVATEYEHTDPVTFKTIKVIKNRFYIPCNLRDNPHTYTPEYIGNLMEATSNNPVLRRAWINQNDWDIQLGGFYPEFDRNKHVINTFPIPPYWMRFMVIDWGSADPCAIIWMCVVGDDCLLPTGDYLPKGALIVYKELYLAKTNKLRFEKDTSPVKESDFNKGLKKTAEEVAALICKEELNEPKGATISYRLCDTKMIATDGGPTLAERMSKPPFNLMGWRMAKRKRAAYTDGRAAGWDFLRARIKGQERRPMIYWFVTCEDSIRTIPLLEHDPDRPGDLIDEGRETHLADCSRYGVMSRPWINSSDAESIIKLNDFETIGIGHRGHSIIIKPPKDGWEADLDKPTSPRLSLSKRRIA